MSESRWSERVVARRELPPREASYAPIPEFCPPALRACLTEKGLDRLYTHQAEMFRLAEEGQNVVITTSTASGKSLGFLLPVLKAVHDDPSARVLLLYPTKALAHDQLRGVQDLAQGLRTGPGGGRPLEMGVYDGDTPPTERRRLREQANLVLTNPDMLNAGLIPAHGRPGYAHLFRHVRYVVIDELHVYRGAFGAHVSNLMRRLLRVCRHYGSSPQFLASSATIANPRQLAEKICHQPFRLVDEDGSPSAGKVIEFWQPPLQEDGTRREVTREMAELLPELIRTRKKTIAFCRSRKETEVVLKEARDHLAAVDGEHDESDLLAAYRGGYTPEERRQVERELLDGRLMGVVSTNALELGVDIGQLEVVVQGGFPGTRASFWQQLGRAGRRGVAAKGVLILATRPIDQFLASDPDWLVRQEAEHAVLDPDNLAVQLAHIRAAAAELPLTIDDAGWFPDLGEVLPVLEEAGELRQVYEAWHWCGPSFPAGEFSLRNSDKDRFKVVDKRDERVLTEMTRSQVYREAHPRAIYLHQGAEYLVEELDLVGHRALVAPVDQNYYTQPDVRTHIEVLVTQEESDALGNTQAWFGDVRVDDTVVGYKMLEFHNHQNLGYEQLHEELSTRLETEAVWVAVPERILEVLGDERLDALRGMTHAIRAVARLTTMAEPGDLLGTSFTWSPHDGAARTSLVCYDNHPGGIGFAGKAFEQIAQVVAGALRLVAECRCRDGCPACVGNYRLSRRLIAWALENLLQEVPLPASLERELPRRHAPPPPAEAPQPSLAWEELPQHWAELQQQVAQEGLPGGDFLQRVESVRLRRLGLVLRVASPGMSRWLGEAAANQQLKRLLARHVILPPQLAREWQLTAEVSPEAKAEAEHKRLKLRRRYEDLTRDEAGSEREANSQLASGYELKGRGTG